MIPHVQDAVDAGVHELLLVVAQVAGDVLGDEDDPPLAVHDEEEAVQRLKGEKRWSEGPCSETGTGQQGPVLWRHSENAFVPCFFPLFPN